MRNYSATLDTIMNTAERKIICYAEPPIQPLHAYIFNTYISTIVNNAECKDDINVAFPIDVIVL